MYVTDNIQAPAEVRSTIRVKGSLTNNSFLFLFRFSACFRQKERRAKEKQNVTMAENTRKSSDICDNLILQELSGCEAV